MTVLSKLKDYQEQPVQAIMKHAKQAKKGQIVFFGDSLIQSYDLKKHFPNKEIYNCGVSGATSALLMHLHTYAIGDYKPSKVVLLIGTNDLGDEYQFDTVDIALNLYQLIQIMKETYDVKEFVVLSPLPIDEAKQKSRNINKNNVLLKRLGVEIKKICLEFEDVTYIDLFDSFLKDGVLNQEWTTDGLHLNEVGYNKLTSLIEDKV